MQSACGAKIQICRTLINRPEIVSIGVVWDSERPSLKHIMSVFATLGTSLKLRDVFQSVVDDRWAQMTNHHLVGVVTYYGKHYSTFFFHTKLRVWIYFDDATVREIGPHWDQVVEKCRRGHFQPLLLLYADPNGTSVPIDSAPRTITHVTPQLQQSTTQPHSKDSLPRRAVTPSPSKSGDFNTQPPATRRAITPNPEITKDDSDDVFDSSSSNNNNNNYRRQIEAIKKSGAILPNKPNIISDQKDRQRSRTNGQDTLRLPDGSNFPRRRDSGNWSGDRNSASSSSSTSLENPYPFLVGGKSPSSPGGSGSSRHSSQSSSPGKSGGGGSQKHHPEYANLGIGVNHHHSHQNGNQEPRTYDPGYDSYSLSSNEAYPLQQSLKHNLQVSFYYKFNVSTYGDFYFWL